MTKKKGYIVIAMTNFEMEQVQLCPTYKPPKNATYREVCEGATLKDVQPDINSTLKQHRAVIILKDYID